MVLARICVITLALASGVTAQRAFESSGNIVCEDARGKQTNLGVGLNPVMARDGHVAMLRGRRYGYGDEFDCSKRDSRNWVSVYNPVTRTERIIPDHAISFSGVNLKFCVFEQMQLSHDQSVLYLVSPVYATSGSLAIVSLTRGSTTFVPGVDFVYVIETGPHRDELIYQRRIYRKSPADGLNYPAYPFMHAHPDGRPISEISDEDFTVAGQ